MEAMNGLGDIFDQWDSEFGILFYFFFPKRNVRALLHICLFVLVHSTAEPQMPPASPERASKLGSPGGMEDNRSRQSPGPSGGNCSQTRNLHSSQDTEEVMFFFLIFLNLTKKVV